MDEQEPTYDADGVMTHTVTTNSFQLTEREIGALFGAVVKELGEFMVIPKVAINNHTDHWNSDITDTTYVLLTNVKVEALERHDDRAKLGDLPPHVKDFNCGPYKRGVGRQ